MGLGGYLMWTAVARRIYNETGLKCLPVEQHEQGTVKIIKSQVFDGNDAIFHKFEDSEEVFPLVLNNPDTNYCKQDTPQKAIHRHDRHIIRQVCEYYGLNVGNLKCELFFKNDEYHKVDSLLSNCDLSGESFITIEPHTKNEYTVNKTYPFEKWQSVVNDLSEKIKIVQIGQKTDQILENCIDMTGKTSFREAALLMSKAMLHVGPEGGLMHAANAAGTKCVIVITGFIHPRMTCYSDNINLWIGKPHGPCGLKVHCEKCKKECDEHDYVEIVRSVESALGYDWDKKWTRI
jgi:ADP-heptose:LPS heptosyltransferase